MRRLFVFALILSIFSLGPVSVAFAEGPILASAERAAQELAQRQAQFLNAPAGSSETVVRAAQAMPGGFLGGNRKLWIAVGLGVLLAGAVLVVDSNVEDATFSSSRTRLDGCTFLCT